MPSDTECHSRGSLSGWLSAVYLQGDNGCVGGVVETVDGDDGNDNAVAAAAKAVRASRATESEAVGESGRT